MTEIEELLNPKITPASLTNGNVNSYEIELKAKSPLKAGDKIYIKSPVTVTPPSNPVC
jgi:hypothetical protein